MLAKCLNPTCSARFRYLSDGRIFHLEIPVAGDTAASRRREYFWLCGRCGATFTVVVMDGAGAVQSRSFELVSGERLEKEEDEKPFLLQRDPNALGT